MFIMLFGATLLARGDCPTSYERKEKTGFLPLMSDIRVKIRIWNFQFTLSLMTVYAITNLNMFFSLYVFQVRKRSRNMYKKI